MLISNVPRFQKNTTGVSATLSNCEFPFKKYKSDFTPFAPYKNVHDSGSSLKNIQKF